MTCTNPIGIGDITTGMLVPCGKCMACRILRTAEWAKRILDEYEVQGFKGCFITLTYDEENIPNDGKLNKKHLVNFVRRLKYKKPHIKYYGIGEYGDTTQRPHYHIIVIGDELNKFEELKKYGKYYSSPYISNLWKYGNNVYGSVNEKSIKYVTGYIRKKKLGKEKDDLFSIFSKGIGKKYFEHKFDKIYKELKSSERKTIVPRYYYKLMEKESPMRILKIKENHQKQKDIFLEKYYYGDSVEMDIAEYKDRLRRLAENRWKEENKKRGRL